MLAQLDQIEQNARQALAQAGDEAALEAWRIAHLGRSAPLMLVFDQLGKLSKEERPLIGRRANEVKRALEAALAGQAEALHQAALRRALEAERLDVSMPGRPLPLGRPHPANKAMGEVIRTFMDMGFQVYRTSEVESDEFNFGLLNMPPHHPARDMWDTFHTTQPGVLLRTHTSPGQVHAMRACYPEPVRAILPGMCYRYEQISARKETQFNQLEVLAVDKGITFADMKGTINDFARRLFGAEVHTRWRASYFPFTEPSAEVDFECILCKGQGCNTCGGTGWLEIMGCGMVHPIVLQNGGYDPQVYSGFAAGLGTERIAMLRHLIEDIRYMWANDLRFLEQF